jgi:hypothetical protein
MQWRVRIARLGGYVAGMHKPSLLHSRQVLPLRINANVGKPRMQILLTSIVLARPTQHKHW